MYVATKAEYEKAKSLKIGDVYTPLGLFYGPAWTRASETVILYSQDRVNWTSKTDDDFRNPGAKD